MMLLSFLLGEGQAGVSVEALGDDVLQQVLQQAEKGVGKIQASQGPARPHRQSSHQREIGQGQLTQGSTNQEGHIQATCVIISPLLLPPIQPGSRGT